MDSTSRHNENFNRRKVITLPCRIIVCTTLAAALVFTAEAQTRKTRRTPARPASVPAARSTAIVTPATPTAAVGINITATDMALLIEGLGIPPEDRARLSDKSEERIDFARNIRRMLAAAEEAKAAGYLARPELKLQTELSRAFVISQAYFKQRQDAATRPEQVITAAEIDAFFNDPATGPQFEALVQDYSKNSQLRGAPVSEEARTGLRNQYGRVMVGMRKGITAGLDRDRKTQLTVMVQQAKLLAGAYAQEMKARFHPTAAEIDAYIAAHPEYDTKAERAKIEAILTRVRAGEDFAKLADEFTEDPSGKGKGGDLGWFNRGVMVKPFEDAAFALKPGEVSSVVETVFGFHIVKLNERRTQAAGEEVHARHILIQYKSASSRPGSAMLPRDRASAALEEEKLARALDEASSRHHIQVVEEYAVGTSKG